ncbi:DUF6160 family protein [Marinobacter confluentis]|uniref:DUF6160 domain-containing protein n=1 Tax=Marinobacter confluentis TaxID=1697557 RepID=A0A4Z1CJB8_9GAMM|nr:DUF6160 family protein [Marinobacter confluentis]TGN41572.1 hypothetical protein E5Q11_03300 [Marinobacter confluentis]
MPSTMKILPVTFALGMSPAVYAELESITDGELSSVTGQSGLTIDYSGRMSMQEFRYENDGKYVAEEIRSGGAGVTTAGAAAGYGENFDDARLTFDVATDGGLDILWQSQSGQPMDWGFSTGTVSVGDGEPGPRTRIYADIQSWGLLRTSQYSVLPAAETGLARSAVYNYAAFTVESLSSSDTPGTIGLQGGYIKSPDFMGNSLDDMNLTDQIPAWAGGQRARSTTPMDDLRAGFAAAEYTVYPLSAGEQGAPTDTIAIGVSGFAADIGVQNLSVGQGDLGRMTLDNLQVSDTIITLTP